VPESPLFDFRNAVHLADERSLAQRKIDYVVWQKPYLQTSRGRPESIGDDTAHCEPALRARFGAPAFEDPHLIAFRISRQTEPSPHAQR